MIKTIREISGTIWFLNLFSGDKNSMEQDLKSLLKVKRGSVFESLQYCNLKEVLTSSYDEEEIAILKKILLSGRYHGLSKKVLEAIVNNSSSKDRNSIIRNTGTYMERLLYKFKTENSSPADLTNTNYIDNVLLYENIWNSIFNSHFSCEKMIDEYFNAIKNYYRYKIYESYEDDDEDPNYWSMYG